jgi:hypothetical protein
MIQTTPPARIGRFQPLKLLTGALFTQVANRLELHRISCLRTQQKAQPNKKRTSRPLFIHTSC